MGSKFHERIKIGIDANGRAMYKDVYASTREAIQLKTAQVIAGRDGNLIQSNRVETANSPLWEEYVQGWYDTFKRPKLKPKSQTKYDGLLRKHVIPALKGKRLGDIRPADVQEALNVRCEYATSYIKDIKNLIAQALDAAEDDGLIAKNPARSKRVNIPSQKATERNALTPEEKADIIAHIPNLKDPNDRKYVALLMYTCLRPGEIYGLRFEDFDLEHNFLSVKRAVSHTKGKAIVGNPKTPTSIRKVPFDPKMLTFFDEIKSEGYVLQRQSKRWATGEDEPYTEQAAKRAWQRIKKQIDIHGMTPYVARHTYATELHRNGVPMKEAMSIMGHKDERMLMRTYVHTDESDLLKAGKIMQKYYESFNA